MISKTGFITFISFILFGGLGVSYLIDMGMPDYQTIQTVVDGKFGKDYQSYFVDSDYEKNDAWWEWSYKYRWLVDHSDETKKGNLYTDFQEANVTQGYSLVDSIKSLNRACKKAYVDTSTNVSNKSNANYESNVWRYCSIGGAKPLSLEDINDSSSYKTGNLGVTKKSILISTDNKYDDTNKWFWDLKQIEFFGLDGKEAKGEKEADGSYFKKFYNDNKNRYLGREHISKACKEAYSLNPSSSASESAPQSNEALKFCSLKGKE